MNLHTPLASPKVTLLAAARAPCPIATFQRPPAAITAAGSDQHRARGTAWLPMQKGGQKKGELLIHLIPREQQRKSMIYSQNR